MPLTRFQRWRIKLSMRYHIRREVWLIGIPCIVAFVIAFWAFYSGFASIGDPLTIGVSANNQTLRQLEFQLLSGNVTAASFKGLGNSASQTAPIKQNLYL